MANQPPDFEFEPKQGIEIHTKKDLLQGHLFALKEAKEKLEEQLGYLIEAIDDIESYIDAITDDSEFKVIID